VGGREREREKGLGGREGGRDREKDALGVGGERRTDLERETDDVVCLLYYG
jgi:hypothetical protein